MECQTVDPECASESEIDQWTMHKRYMIRYLNKKIDLKSFEKTIREDERWSNSMSMAPGQYGEYGFRFRKNRFEKTDSWIPIFGPVEEIFYDITFFNADLMIIDPKYFKKIA